MPSVFRFTRGTKTTTRIDHTARINSWERNAQRLRRQRALKSYDLIVKGLSQRMLIHNVRNSWGLSDDSATNYIREARAIVRADLGDLDRADMLATKIQLLEQMASDAAAA